jgi:hypothetical protein
MYTLSWPNLRHSIDVSMTQEEVKTLNKDVRIVWAKIWTGALPLRSGIANKWTVKFTLVLIELYHSLNSVPNAFFPAVILLSLLLKMCYLIT